MTTRAEEAAPRRDEARSHGRRPSAVILLGVFFTSADRALLQQIADRQDQMATKLDELATTEQNLETKTDALLAFAAAQQTSIADLQAQIAAAGNVDPALQAIIDRMTAEAAKIAAFLPAPPPVAG